MLVSSPLRKSHDVTSWVVQMGSVVTVFVVVEWVVVSLPQGAAVEHYGFVSVYLEYHLDPHARVLSTLT